MNRPVHIDPDAVEQRFRAMAVENIDRCSDGRRDSPEEVAFFEMQRELVDIQARFHRWVAECTNRGRDPHHAAAVAGSAFGAMARSLCDNVAGASVMPTFVSNFADTMNGSGRAGNACLVSSTVHGIQGGRA